MRTEKAIATLRKLGFIQAEGDWSRSRGNPYLEIAYFAIPEEISPVAIFRNTNRNDFLAEKTMREENDNAILLAESIAERYALRHCP